MDLYITFVNLAKAFDRVNQYILWNILWKCGCLPKFINILKKLHSGMSANVDVGGLVSEPFEVGWE